jgi:hypothetical protein
LNLIGGILRGRTDDENTVGDGYPGTDLIVAITRRPPTTQRDDQFQEGFRQLDFTVDGIPTNGTVTLNGDWDLQRAQDALSNNTVKAVSHEYDILDMPSGQLPILIRADLHRDAREYLETKESDDRRSQRRAFQDDPKEFEGRAVLTITVEAREENVELNVAAGSGWIHIEKFRVEMQSTFQDIDWWPKEGSTYNPEKKMIEWTRYRPRKGKKAINYSIFGQVEELMGLGRISATIRGEIPDKTLTGTRIQGLYDQTGQELPDKTKPPISHKVIITGDIEIDPTALGSEVRKVMNATVSLRDTPFDAYDRLQMICNREGMTITTSKEPSGSEPVAGQKNVFAISRGEKDDGDDEPGKLEVKREYGDEGIVYAHFLVSGRYTPMARNREVSQSDEILSQAENRLVRSDEGGIETRGKSTIDISARSVNPELNSQLIRTIQEGLGSGTE